MEYIEKNKKEFYKLVFFFQQAAEKASKAFALFNGQVSELDLKKILKPPLN